MFHIFSPAIRMSFARQFGIRVLYSAVAVLLALGPLGLSPASPARASHAGTVDVCTLPGRIIDDGDLTYENYDVVVDGCTNAIINGQHTFENLAIINGGRLSHWSATTSVVRELNLTITSAVTIDAASSINVGGQGYFGAYRSGNNSAYGRTIGNVTGGQQRAGGSYGGLGGWGSAGCCPGSEYGDYADPREHGSGGGGSSAWTAYSGGNGGGVVIIVADSLTVDGSILANGSNASFTGAGGSGGAINISVETLAGLGEISADGGSNTGPSTIHGGGGGGGRVAINYTINSYTGTASATGGSGYNHGGAGTIFWRENGNAYGRLLLDNEGRNARADTTPLQGGTFETLTVRNGARLAETGGLQLTVLGAAEVDNGQLNVQDFVAGSLTLTNGSTLPQPSSSLSPQLLVNGLMDVSNTTLELQHIEAENLMVGPNVVLRHPTATTSDVWTLDILVNDTFVLDATSSINVSGRGYIGAYRSGNNTAYGRTLGNVTGGQQRAGGSYGGLGGNGSAGCCAHPVYGDPNNPLEHGSGGGGSSAWTAYAGGNGGGVVIITADSLAVDGSILANGTNASFTGAGGSGGAIKINSQNMAGTGSIAANGGGNTGPSAIHGGGGGGGRVYVCAANQSFTGPMSANGGLGYGNGQPGSVVTANTGCTGASSDTTSPTVANVNSSADTGDGALDEGEATDADITQLLVTFGEDVKDTGDAAPDGVTNPANYSLSGAATGVVNIDSVTYNGGSFTATLNVNGGAALPPDGYTLTVSGAGIEDLAGNKLDGNGDGTGGDDFTRAFAVSATAPMLLVSSQFTDRVLRYNGLTGAFDAIFASGGGLDQPAGLVIGPDGNLYVSGFSSDTVVRFNGQTGALVSVFASGSGMNGPEGLLFGPDGNLYVANWGTDTVLRYNGTTGAFMNVFASGGGLDYPIDMVFGPDGNLYVSGYYSDAVHRYNGTTGAFMGLFASGGGMDGPIGLAFGPDGNLYVSSRNPEKILRYNGATGAFMGGFASGGGLSVSYDLAFGPDGNLYVASLGTDNVLRFNGSTGALIGTFASGSGLDQPTFLVFTTPDTTPPTVANVNSNADTGDGALDEGEATNAAITQLLVTFDEDVTGADDAGNYALTGLASGAIAIGGVTYDGGTFMAALDVNGGAALPDDEYTLTVSGDIADLAGNAVGADFVRNFSVDRIAPSFVNQTLNYDAGILTLNYAGEMNESGSVTVVVSEDPGGTLLASNTSQAGGSAPYTYSDSLGVPSPAPALIRVDITITDAVGNETVGPALLLDSSISAASGTSGATDPNTSIPVSMTGDVALVNVSSAANRPTAAVSAGATGGDVGMTFTVNDPTQDLSLCGPEGSCVISVEGNPVPTTRTPLLGGGVEYSPSAPIMLAPGETVNTGLTFDPDEGGAGVGSATDPTTGAGADVTGDARQVTIGADADERPTSVVTAGSAGGAFTISFTISDALELDLCGLFNGCRIFEDGAPLETDRTELAGNRVRYSVEVTFTPGQVKLYALKRFDVLAPTVYSASIFAESAGSGNAQVTGLAGAVSDTSTPVTLTISNLQSPGITVNDTANQNGSFGATIPANSGDTVEIVATDAVGNTSTAVYRSVYVGTGFAMDMLSNVDGIGEVGAIADMFVSGSYVVVVGEYGCLIVNISNPSAPIIVGRLMTVDAPSALAGGATSVYVSGEVIYLTSSYGLVVIDMRNPANPSLIDTLALPGARSVVVREEHAYVLYAGGMAIIDLGYAGGATVVETVVNATVGGETVDLSAVGSAGAQLILGGDTLVVINAACECVPVFNVTTADPEVIVLTHVIRAEPEPTGAVLISGDTLIIGGGSGVTVVKLTGGGVGGTVIETISGPVGGGVVIEDVTSLWGGGTLIVGSGSGGVFILRYDLGTGGVTVSGGYATSGASVAVLSGRTVVVSCGGCPKTEVFNLAPDLDPPTFENATTLPALVRGGQTVTIEVTVRDNSGVSAVECRVPAVGGGTQTIQMSRVPGSEDRWRAIYTPDSDLPSGTFTPRFTATDPAGNEGTHDGVPAVIDNDNPEIGDTGSAAPDEHGGEPLARRGECVTITAGVTDATSDVASVEALITRPDGSTVTVTLTRDGNKFVGQYCPGEDDPGGEHSVTIRAEDGAGNGSEADCGCLFHVNDPPRDVIIGELTEYKEGETVTFDGTFSDADSDDSDTHTIEWTFGDGIIASGLNPTHVYADDGVYTITLTVEDSYGKSSSANTEVIVHNVGPTVEAGDDQTQFEGTPVELAPATFNDRGTADTHTSEIDSGILNALETGALLETPFGPPGSGSGMDGTVDGSHAYPDDGNFVVEVCVTDDENKMGCDFFLVTVENAAPVIKVEDAVIDEGETFKQTGSFEDGGADEWTATVDYGVGEGPQALDLNADKTFNLSYTYGDDGQYTVTVTVADDDGGEDVRLLTVTVNNLDPLLTLDSSGAIDFSGGQAFTGRVGLEQTHQASASDPGSDDLTFNWNSGAENVYYNDDTGADALLSPAGIYPFLVNDSSTFTFSAAGIYIVSVQVADDDGGAALANLKKLVTGANACTRSQGFWKHQFSGRGQHQVDDATLINYLTLVNFTSSVFSESVSLDILADAANGFSASGDDMRLKAQSQLLAAWLNYAQGSVGWDEIVHDDDEDDEDGIGPLPFNQVMAQAETILLNPNASQAELKRAKNLAEMVNRLNEKNGTCDDRIEEDDEDNGPDAREEDDQNKSQDKDTSKDKGKSKDKDK